MSLILFANGPPVQLDDGGKFLGLPSILGFERWTIVFCLKRTSGLVNGPPNGRIRTSDYEIDESGEHTPNNKDEYLYFVFLSHIHFRFRQSDR